MHRGWLSVEHYRMHLMELWPDGPRKEAGLAAARSTLESLSITCLRDPRSLARFAPDGTKPSR